MKILSFLLFFSAGWSVETNWITNTRYYPDGIENIIIPGPVYVMPTNSGKKLLESFVENTDLKKELAQDEVVIRELIIMTNLMNERRTLDRERIQELEKSFDRMFTKGNVKQGIAFGIGFTLGIGVTIASVYGGVEIVKANRSSNNKISNLLFNFLPAFGRQF